jgi:hypothetical protein
MGCGRKFVSKMFPEILPATEVQNGVGVCGLTPLLALV